MSLQSLPLVASAAIVLAFGLAWSFAAFPRHRAAHAPRTDRLALGILERLFLGAVFGLAGIPLAGLVWAKALGIPITQAGAATLLLAGAAAGIGLGAARRRHLARQEGKA